MMATGRHFGYQAGRHAGQSWPGCGWSRAQPIRVGMAGIQAKERRKTAYRHLARVQSWRVGYSAKMACNWAICTGSQTVLYLSGTYDGQRIALRGVFSAAYRLTPDPVIRQAFR
jgi:hypothetical protein